LRIATPLEDSNFAAGEKAETDPLLAVGASLNYRIDAASVREADKNHFVMASWAEV
jgi:hypothetical protein